MNLLVPAIVIISVRQIFGSRVRVDSTAKVAEIELAEKEKMKEKVDRILKHGINCFINRCERVLQKRVRPQNLSGVPLW